MAMNPLPPQAYTKDTLLRAYAWLQNQNPSIREMATTPDILVSLYLKTTRDGEEALDRPSIQNFKNELKSLAGLMGELEKDHQKAQPPPLPQPVTPVASAPAGATFSDFNLGTGASSGANVAGSLGGSGASTFGAMGPPSNIFNNPFPGAPGSSGTTPLPENFGLLDPLSRQMLLEVKEGFNLSDQTEALRLLIKLGYLKARKILTE